MGLYVEVDLSILNESVPSNPNT